MQFATWQLTATQGSTCHYPTLKIKVGKENSVDYHARMQIEPDDTSKSGKRYQITIASKKIALCFEPRYYHKHCGLKYYEPVTFHVWKKLIGEPK
jgi:hypothetical protein